MATFYWIGGAGTQDWGDGDNWSNSRFGASASAVPTNGDTVYVLDGTSNITNTGCNGWLLLHVGFQGTMGTTGAPMDGAGAGSLRYYSNGGNSYFTGLDGTIRIFQHSGTVYISGTDFSGDVLEIGFGSNVVLTETATNLGQFTTYPNQSGCRIMGGGVTIEGTSSSGDSNIFICGGAVVTTSRVGTNEYTVYGPNTVLTVGGSAGVNNLEVGHGARYNHASSGTISNVIAWGPARLTTLGATGPFTVTDSTVSGGVKLFDSPSVPVTFTNATGKLGVL